jgi:hypothetical protein
VCRSADGRASIGVQAGHADVHPGRACIRGAQIERRLAQQGLGRRVANHVSTPSPAEIEGRETAFKDVGWTLECRVANRLARYGALQQWPQISPILGSPSTLRGWLFPWGGFDAADIDEYNRQTGIVYEHIGNLLILHYKATERAASAFWNHGRGMDIPTTCAARWTCSAPVAVSFATTTGCSASPTGCR